ncbi:hypothetical protein AURDEDRAFT_166617 [Auricularia subglabra TFB-10046 SS5]|nr:hypothetical protein AURDEDRAFT_166617 [Auricularia subglabra TFB-10046 SS5]
MSSSGSSASSALSSSSSSATLSTTTTTSDTGTPTAVGLGENVASPTRPPLFPERTEPTRSPSPPPPGGSYPASLYLFVFLATLLLLALSVAILCPVVALAAENGANDEIGHPSRSFPGMPDMLPNSSDSRHRG